MEKMTPERVKILMKKHGENISLQQAEAILKFMRMLASIAVKSYLEKKNNV